MNEPRIKFGLSFSYLFLISLIGQAQIDTAAVRYGPGFMLNPGIYRRVSDFKRNRPGANIQGLTLTELKQLFKDWLGKFKNLLNR